MSVVISLPRCPLYAAPEEGALLADELLLGWQGEVLERRGSWVRLRTDYRYEGWARADCLLWDSALIQDWLSRPKTAFLAATGDVLSRPGFRSPPLTPLLRGCLLAPAGPPEGLWQPVFLPDGQRGFVRGDGLEGGLPGTVRERVRGHALSYLDVPYRWGGKTPLGIDCSGLTFMAFRLSGVTIYRDAALREDFPVASVPPGERQPADLLYFPGHVALFLGNERYIHASARAGRVALGSLDPKDPLFRPDLPPEALTAVGRYTGT